MTATLVPPLKYHGGKHYLAKRIVELMPPHRNYVEPYAGGLAVLLHKTPEGVSEVVNDIDAHVSNFWQVVAHEHTFEAFRRIVEAQPFGEADWRVAANLMRSMGWSECNPDCPPPPSATCAHVARASWFFVALRQSLAGRGESFAPISTGRTRRGMNEQVSAWLTAVEGLPAVHARLKRVVILNREALDVIRQFDKPDTVMYLDPPYLPDTRTSPAMYRHEMTLDDHNALLTAVSLLEHAKFVLSGYRNEMYDGAAGACHWRRIDFELPNNAAGGTEKRRMTECVWLNY